MNCTVTPSAWRFTLPCVTIPPIRNERPCGTSFAATWLGVKKNTRFSWNAASTKAAVTPSATRPPAIIASRFCLASSVAWCCGAAEAEACESAALAQHEQHDFRKHEAERHEVGAPNIERVAAHCKEILQAAPIHADALA